MSKADLIHVFWDVSNIYLGAQEACRRYEAGENDYDVRLHFDNLFRLSTDTRSSKKCIAVASASRGNAAALDRLGSSIPVDVEVYERGVISGTEQAVDQVIQAHMLRSLADEEPGVIVLLTGDGADYQHKVGFQADLERLHRYGWGVELLSWKHSCNKKFRKWVETVGSFVELDKYYLSITYIENRRRAKEPVWKQRPTSASDSNFKSRNALEEEVAELTKQLKHANQKLVKQKNKDAKKGGANLARK